MRCIPAFPFLVVIRITPLAACEPYRAAAEAPFSIFMLSMSSGFRLEIPSPASRFTPSFSPPITVEVDSVLLFSMGTPSMTYNGWLLPVAKAERAPRMATLADPPKPAALLVICTPAVFPARALIMFGSLARVSSSPPSCWVE